MPDYTPANQKPMKCSRNQSLPPLNEARGPAQKRRKTSFEFLLSGLLLAAPCLQEAHASDPYAKAVVFSRILQGNAGNTQTNVANALGAPDNVSVSLGGPGASIILDMGADTPITNGPGADLEIRELGAAFGGVDESYRVLVSNSTETNTFLLAGEGRALSLIDISPSALTSARYVWIQDLATETLNTTVPGSDIDAVRGLHFGGGTDEVRPPADVAVRLTGQGAWLSWTPSATPNVTSYAIRRSLDGISFGSAADATVSPQETAWHDQTLPLVGTFYYAVSAVSNTLESSLVVVSVPSSRIDLFTNSIVHLGDDTVSAWADPSPQRDLTVNFTLPAFAEGPDAELFMDVWDVDNTGNAILLNGGKIGSVPAQGAESWQPKTLTFAAGALQAGLNTLVLSARNSSGGTTGALDDFQVRNISLVLYGAQPSINLFTSTRFTTITAGETNVTLRWVVQQTPSLAPITWETVSGPIEWKGTISPTNGFFRLQDAP
jgi:hypothetical protein